MAAFNQPQTGACFLVLVALSTVWISASANPFCTPETPKDDQPKLPSLAYKNFKAEYKVSFIDKKKVMWAREVYDNWYNKLLMESTESGVLTGLLLDYKDNSYINYEYKMEDRTQSFCNISKLNETKSDNFNLFGYTTASTRGSPLKIYSAAKVLSFASDQGYVYVGKDDIDGLPVEHWRSCITWDKDVTATFKVNYYFTVKGFEPSGGLKYNHYSFPVRAEVEGEITANDKKRKIHHVYDYLDFQVYASYMMVPSRFNLPDFIDCSGNDVPTAWDKPFPTLPDSMMYTLERLVKTKSKVTIDTMKVYLDAKHKIVRVDQDQTTSISDFNTGVEYIIKDNVCSPRPIDPDNVPSAEKKNGFIQMKDRPEISYLKKDYFYSGAKEYRSIAADGFAGGNKDEVFEAYIYPVLDTPLGVKVSEKSSGTVRHYNIFDFADVSHKSNENPFDVSHCKSLEEIRSYHMILHAIRLDDDTDVTIQSLREITAQAAGVSIMQISHDDYIFDQNDNELHWFVSFLDGESKNSQAKIKNRIPSKSVHNIVNLVFSAIFTGKLEITVDDGRYSYYEPTITAKDMFTHNSYIVSETHDEVMRSFTGLKNTCVKDFKTNTHDSIKDSARACAQACLNSTITPCKFFEYIEATKHCRWSSDESALTTLENRAGCDTYRSAAITRFIMDWGDFVVNADAASYKKSNDAEACAKLCLEEGGFNCQSFDFCESTQQCLLYDTHSYSQVTNPGPTVSSIECFHYTRDIRDQYHYEFGKEAIYPGQVEVTSKDRTDCAYLCSSAKEGCTMYSSCWREETQQYTCTLVPLSKTSAVTLKPNHYCSVNKAMGIVSADGQAQASGLTRSGGDAESGYSGGAMFGVAVAMILIGVGLGVLTVFLLRKFRGWEGFQ